METLDGETLIKILKNVSALKYYFVATAMVLFWDIALTLDTEVEHIWSQRWGAFTILWFLLRYVPPLMEIVALYALFDPSWSFEVQVCLNYNYSSGCPVAHQKFRCQKYLPFVGTYSFVCVSLVQCVFAIRIYAIYGGKKLILIVFALFFVGELSLIAYFINRTTAIRDLPVGVTGCAGGGVFGSRGGAAFWGPSVFFDIVVFAMTVYKSYVTIKHNTRSFGILRVLLRDGSLYFAVVFFLNMVNILTIILAPLDLLAVNANLTTTLPVVITTRLILNLKATRIRYTTDHHSRSQPRTPGGNTYGSEQPIMNQLDQSTTVWSFNAVLNVLGVLEMGSMNKSARQGPTPNTYQLDVRT